MENEDARLVRFHASPGDAWDAMYDDCLKAKRSIDFEQYILMDDKAGERFLKLFAAKAREGVAVRLLVDGVGSRGLLLSPKVEDIRRAGGEVRFYNSVGWTYFFSLDKWFPRNHNKVLIIDNETAYIGSVCLCEIMRGWRDIHARVTDGIVGFIARDFGCIWEMVGRGIRNPFCPPPPQNGPLRYIVSQKGRRSNLLFRELLARIETAKSRVLLVTPYFLPPWHLRRALYAAVARGVEVVVMTSEKTDVGIADIVSRSYYPALLRNGVKLRLFTKTVLHAKYAAIDDDWATLGSANMDYLSLLKNREANIVVRDKAIAAEIHARFAHDMRDCRIADMAYYHEIPRPFRILGYLGRFMRRIL